MAFHAGSHICFERLVDGGVRIFERGNPVKLSDGNFADTEVTIVELTASRWAQAVASVSQRGTEYPGSHGEALDLHQRD